MKKHRSAAVYEDSRYRVTAEIIATPSRFYPVQNTTARIRRDPLWAALAGSVVSFLGVAVYADLLLASEIAWVVGLAAVALVVGHNVAILQVDAAGHAGAMIVARKAKVITLYRAIIEARNQALDRPRPEVTLFPDD